MSSIYDEIPSAQLIENSGGFRDGKGSEGEDAATAPGLVTQGNAVNTDTSAAPPDGGTRAWLVVLGGWCAVFCTFWWINTIGVWQDYYVNTMLPQYSASTISWIPSFEGFLIFTMGPIVGRLSDSFGPRCVVIGGSILHVFGLMMTSISTKYYQVLLAQGICGGMGLGAIYQPAMSNIASWFGKKCVTAHGVTATGSSIGGIILPIMFRQLIGRISFGWAMRTATFLMLFLLSIFILTTKARVAPRPQRVTRENLLHPFQDMRMVLLMAGFVVFNLGVWIPLNYMITAALMTGMQPNLAEYSPAIFSAGSLFGGMLSGLFADKIGTYNIFVLSCLSSGILVLAFWIPVTGDAATLVYYALLGLSTGAFFSLAVAVIGYWTGVNFFFSSFPALVTNPIAGQILARDGGSYWGVKVYCGIVIIVGALLILGTRLCQTGLVLWAKF
ncbi:MFS general substrate transporter [Aspergillus ellipticus CBS 707.79]|uniref:MFS general substrate transporter n=1 Tax=Aspergillus ellipticus CBS 707.79 TaxID=1448320 RepID=A0A319CZN0_9EURO|nr:MFS general substrate transporter [Aspergillus ellipticus CBS 707.79]